MSVDIPVSSDGFFMCLNVPSSVLAKDGQTLGQVIDCSTRMGENYQVLLDFFCDRVFPRLSFQGSSPGEHYDSRSSPKHMLVVAPTFENIIPHDCNQFEVFFPPRLDDKDERNAIVREEGQAWFHMQVESQALDPSFICKGASVYLAHLRSNKETSLSEFITQRLSQPDQVCRWVNLEDSGGSSLELDVLNSYVTRTKSVNLKSSSSRHLAESIERLKSTVDEERDLRNSSTNVTQTFPYVVSMEKINHPDNQAGIKFVWVVPNEGYSYEDAVRGALKDNAIDILRRKKMKLETLKKIYAAENHQSLDEIDTDVFERGYLVRKCQEMLQTMDVPPSERHLTLLTVYDYASLLNFFLPASIHIPLTNRMKTSGFKWNAVSQMKPNHFSKWQMRACNTSHQKIKNSLCPASDDVSQWECIFDPTAVNHMQTTISNYIQSHPDTGVKHLMFPLSSYIPHMVIPPESTSKYTRERMPLSWLKKHQFDTLCDAFQRAFKVIDDSVTLRSTATTSKQRIYNHRRRRRINTLPLPTTSAIGKRRRITENQYAAQPSSKKSKEAPPRSSIQRHDETPALLPPKRQLPATFYKELRECAITDVKKSLDESVGCLHSITAKLKSLHLPKRFTKLLQEEYSKKSLSVFLSRMRKGNPNLSPTTRIVLKYLEEEEKKITDGSFYEPLPCVDERFTSSSNFYTYFSLQFRELCGVYNMFPVMRIVAMIIFDVLTLPESDKEMGFPSGKIHALLFGPPDVGKSFCLEVLPTILLPDVLKFSRTETPKSMYHGGDASHKPTIYDEIPLWLRDPKKMSPSQQDWVASMTSVLTQGYAAYDGCVKNQTIDKQVTTDINIQMLKTVIVNLNAPPTGLHEPFLSRFTVLRPPQNEDKYATVSNINTSLREGRNATITHVDKKKTFRRVMRCHQTLTSLVTLMVTSRVIPNEPSTELGDKMLDLYMNIVKVVFPGIGGGNRDIGRCDRLMRIQTISDAVCDLMDVSRSPLTVTDPITGERKFVPFNFEDLQRMAPYYLFSRHGSMVRIVGEFMNQLCPPEEYEIMRLFAKHMCSFLADPPGLNLSPLDEIPDEDAREVPRANLCDEFVQKWFSVTDSTLEDNINSVSMTEYCDMLSKVYDYPPMKSSVDEFFIPTITGCDIHNPNYLSHSKIVDPNYVTCVKKGTLSQIIKRFLSLLTRGQKKRIDHKTTEDMIKTLSETDIRFIPYPTHVAGNRDQVDERSFRARYPESPGGRKPVTRKVIIFRPVTSSRSNEYYLDICVHYITTDPNQFFDAFIRMVGKGSSACIPIHKTCRGLPHLHVVYDREAEHSPKSKWEEQCTARYHATLHLTAEQSKSMLMSINGEEPPSSSKNEQPSPSTQSEEEEDDEYERIEDTPSHQKYPIKQIMEHVEKYRSPRTQQISNNSSNLFTMRRVSETRFHSSH